MTAAAQVILHAEAFAVHRASLASYWAHYGRNARRRLSLGALIPAVDYVDALRVRRAGIAAVARLFGRLDLVIMPTTGGPAPTIAALRDVDATIGSGTPLYTAYWNAAGNPAVSVPMGTVRGLPLGLQIVGTWYDEASVLSAAAALVVAG
jgi:aspartyl-tRNA(Asn)/glutamyl-tRNA(Gln) amidotransferase subunit A